MSLGGGANTAPCDSANPALTTAITNLRNAGVAVLIASGNGGQTGSIASPACISTAIAVGSTTKSDELASYSNLSDQVALLATGSNINGAVPGGGYAKKSGTSMAAPLAAGSVALLKQARPIGTVDAILNALTCSGKSLDTRPADVAPEPLDPVSFAPKALPPGVTLEGSTQQPGIATQ